MENILKWILINLVIKQLIISNCKICEKQFARESWRKQFYCSMKCKGIASRGKKLCDFECRFCKKTSKVWPYQLRTKVYCSRLCKGESMKGSVGYWNGKVRESMLGEKNHGYVKDRSKLQRYNDANKDRRSYAYNNWRKNVWLRDNYKCRISNSECSGRIEVHHILSYADFPELRYEVNNGITLCRAHHPRRRAEEKQLIPFDRISMYSKVIF